MATMESESDLEGKYKKLALEYSKIRSQASVLKKAVLDEQQKNLQLKGLIQQQEQKIRKHDQEMESVIFRNDQLTKRVTVLQDELKTCRCGKKTKKPIPNDDEGLVLRDEELYKRTQENAKLVSSIADKDLEIMAYREKVGMLEDKIKNLDKAVNEVEDKYKGDIIKLKNENKQIRQQAQEVNCKTDSTDGANTTNQYWENEAKRLQTECELLRSRPQTDEELTKYYEDQIEELTDIKDMAIGEANTLWAENASLGMRLDEIIRNQQRMQENSEKNAEELKITCEHYKNQLDAMTEHLAAQNEKIAKQCDDIQVLKYNLNVKK